MPNLSLDSLDIKKIDPRVVRTRQALRKALGEIIQEKKIGDISVEEITQRANLNRATFYLHYKDKEDILLDEFSEKVNELAYLLTKFPSGFWVAKKDNNEINEDEPHNISMALIFKHASENAEFYRLMLKGESTKRIADRINKIVMETYKEVILTRFPNRPALIYQEIPFDVLAVYFSGALLSCMSWWLEQEPGPSPENMARVFQNLFIPGVHYLIQDSEVKPGEGK